MNIPELLAPAGDPEVLETALYFGADAVYGGMRRFGLRAFAGNFDETEMRSAAEACHRLGKKLYVTLNAFPTDEEWPDFLDAARQAEACGADAVIVSDLGAILAVRRACPSLPVHVSTQANTMNSEAVRHYAALGCSRVILARELTLKQIEALCAQADGIELETFVHGASCMAYSGRCLLSSALTGRSGNRGACAQPCRWQYAIQEEKQPGVYLPVAEDSRGTYIFSARDLNLMPLLPQLCGAGIRSLKIEGRMKTAYYVATVTAAYRKGLDLLRDGGEAAFAEALPDLMAELACASHRESDTGFLLGPPARPAGPAGCTQNREYLGKVLETGLADGTCVLQLKNRFYRGDPLELLTPQGVLPFEAGPLYREKTGEWLDTFGVGGERIRLRLPEASHAGDILRGPVRNHQTSG